MDPKRSLIDLAKSHNIEFKSLVIGRLKDAEISNINKNAVVDLASITKVVTGLLTAVFVETGDLDLNEVVIRTVSGEISVSHLLAHASGMSVDDESQFIAGIKERRIYSNAGYKTLSRFFETKTGQPFNHLVEQDILIPWGLTDFEASTTGERGLKGNLEGLYALSKRLLLNETPGISAEVVKQMRTNHFGKLPGVVPGIGYYEDNSWGLGFEVKGNKTGHWMPKSASAETFGHFGRLGAFFFVDPSNLIALSGISGDGFTKDSRIIWSKIGETLYEIKENL